VFKTSGGNWLKASWTATADDGSDASSGAASEYDLRYSTLPITEANFDAANEVTACPAPGIKGTAEEAYFTVGAITGEVYVALKIGDEVPNWSDVSNVDGTDPATVGLTPMWPEDLYSTAPGFAVQFTYLRGADVKPAYISFSDRPDFPQKPILNNDGSRSMTKRFPLKTNVTYWKASTGQWRAVQKLAGTSGTLYWRLEGRTKDYKGLYGAARSLFFDTGAIPSTNVAPSHDVGGEDGIWPEADEPVTFSWTDATQGMELFYVDVSTDNAFPMKDRRKTMTLGRGKVDAPELAPTVAEWKRLRKLAGTNGGELFWRVRASDKYKTVGCAGAVKTLIVDGGEFAVGALDLSAASPVLTWTHTGEGIVKYNVQISATADFPPTARETVTIPPRATEATSYTFTDADIARIARMASRLGATTLHYRVRGEDADRQFVTYSNINTTTAP
jgi:hypothetical protein